MRSIDGLDASAIANFLETRLHGDDHAVLWLDPFPNRRSRSLSFLTKMPDRIEVALEAACVIAPAGLVKSLYDAGYTVIESEYPKYDMSRAFAALVTSRVGQNPGIHPSAVIGEDVHVDASAYIGPGCVLQGDITVGPHCRIASHVCLSNDVVLDVGVSIRNGAVIGEDAYSFGFGPQGDTVRFPSVGGVRIGKNVEIGNNVVISRGVHGDTVLHDGCRINDLAHLGNTVTVGERSLVMANCDISASVVIGSDCWIAQSAAIRQGVKVGDGAQVGMGAVVLHDVPAGVVVMGIPARVVRQR